MASKTFIAAGLGAGLLLGGVAGLAVTVPTGAFAQDADTSETGPMGPGQGREHGPEHEAMHGADGPRGEHGGMHGRRGGGPGGPSGMRLETAAEAIGISTDELRAQLREGKSLAAIADANGVSTDALVDSLTAEARTRITDMVNRVPGERMERAEAQASGGN